MGDAVDRESEWTALTSQPEFRAALARIFGITRREAGFTREALAAEAAAGPRSVRQIEQQRCDLVSRDAFERCARALSSDAAELIAEASAASYRDGEPNTEGGTSGGPAAESSRSLLPPLPEYLVGRDAARDQAVGDLQSHQGIIFYGAPGQGKTTLARYIASAAADQFALGAVEVDLESERQIENLPRRIAVALGFPDVPSSYEVLRDQRVLLLLDGFDLLRLNTGPEALRKALESLIGSLAPEARVIITCQSQFEKKPLVTREVSPLLVPDGIALFHELSEGQYEENANEVADFVSDLGGHPLSIKIIARFGREAGLELEEVRRMWRGKWAHVAESPDPSLDDRSLRAAFELSFDTLPRRAKLLFLALGLLPDGVSPRLVASVWQGQDVELYNDIRLLRQRSLLDDTAKGKRNRLRGPLFLFADAKGKERDTLKGQTLRDLEALRGRIEQYVDQYVAQNAPQFRNADNSYKNKLIREEFHNIHASLDRRLEPSTEPETVSAAMSVLALYWAYHNNLSGAHNPISSPDDAINYLKKAQQIFLANSLDTEARSCRYYVGNIHWLRGEASQARTYLLDLKQTEDADDDISCDTLRTFAHIEYKEGSIAVSVTLYKEVIKRASGRFPDCVFRCWVGLLDAYRKLTYYDEGRKLFDGFSNFLDACTGDVAGNLYRGYAYLLLSEGALGEARMAYEMGIQRFGDNEFGLAHCWRGIGDILVRQGDFYGAESAFERSMIYYQGARKLRSLGVALVGLGRGRLALAKRDYAAAVSELRQVVTDLDPNGLNEPYELAVAHELLGDTHVEAGSLDKARAEYRLALNLFDRTGAARVVDRIAFKLAGIGKT